LRDLKSTGFTNSKKPFLVMDLNTLDVKNEGDLGTIKTVNNGYGNNPTLNQVFRIPLELPVFTNNVPALSCFVEDFFLKIFKQKLGFFEISIEDAIIDTKKNFEQMENKIEEFKIKRILIFN
jgi:hypothetical protein